jgi:hypothetical protein
VAHQSPVFQDMNCVSLGYTNISMEVTSSIEMQFSDRKRNYMDVMFCLKLNNT